MVELYTGFGYEINELLNLDGGGSTTVVLREADGSFGVKNIPSGPPLPIDYKKYDLPYPVPNGETQIAIRGSRKITRPIKKPER